MIKSWEMRWSGHVWRMKEMRNKKEISVWKPGEKKAIGRPKAYMER
jgi:hypothetical protein